MAEMQAEMQRRRAAARRGAAEPRAQRRRLDISARPMPGPGMGPYMGPGGGGLEAQRRRLDRQDRAPAAAPAPTLLDPGNRPLGAYGRGPGPHPEELDGMGMDLGSSDFDDDGDDDDGDEPAAHRFGFDRPWLRPAPAPAPAPTPALAPAPAPVLTPVPAPDRLMGGGGGGGVVAALNLELIAARPSGELQEALVSSVGLACSGTDLGCSLWHIRLQDARPRALLATILTMAILTIATGDPARHAGALLAADWPRSRGRRCRNVPRGGWLVNHGC